MARDLAEAVALVDAGRTLVDGAPAGNPSRLVAPAEAITVFDPPPRHVSRGGDKLAAALDRFGIDPDGLRVLDAGASTGGFTDCVLQRGAREVAAVDVGRAQLHQRLRTDPRVIVRERTNIRHLGEGDFGDPFDLVVADLSFISLSTVIPTLIALAHPDAHLVLLVKPQFEAERAEVDRGRGIITDPAIWRRTLLATADALTGAGATIMGVMTSPLRGAEGNVEFLLHAAVTRPEAEPAPITELVEHAVTEAER